MTQWIVDAAAELLHKKYGVPPALQLSEIVYGLDGSPSNILLCDFRNHPDGLLPTVIVKHTHGPDEGLLYEAAALEFLGETVPGITPRLYGVDAERRIMILEVLSPPADILLGDILFDYNADYAEQALHEFQATLARMHLATAQHETLFRQILARYGPPTQHSRHRIHTINEALQSLPAMLMLIDTTVEEAALQDIDEAAGIINRPGLFSTLVHGDATPANVFYRGGRCGLIDFETAGFRHCLLDGSYARLRYIHSVWARAIPPDVQRRLMDTYRGHFLAGTGLDEEAFNHHLLACCAGWLAGLCALLPAVMEQDRKWGRSTNRQRIVAGLQHFASLAEELDDFHALRALCHTALRRLYNTWPEADCTMKPYPAFA